MCDPVTLLMAKAHQNRLLKEAKEAKEIGMLKAARTARPRLQERLFVRLGNFLISAGMRLQERCQPVMYPGPETHQPGC